MFFDVEQGVEQGVEVVVTNAEEQRRRRAKRLKKEELEELEGKAERDNAEEKKAELLKYSEFFASGKVWIGEFYCSSKR